VPTSARWWTEKAEEHVEWLKRESEPSDGHLKRNRRYLLAFQRDCTWAWIRASVGPDEVGRKHIRVVRGCGIWGPRTLKTKFSVLRGFMRWADNPVSDGKNPVWRLP
jgi:hypothetical protein